MEREVEQNAATALEKAESPVPSRRQLLNHFVVLSVGRSPP